MNIIKSLWGAALFSALAPVAARACGAVEEKSFAPVKVNAEAAVIVWDEANKTEHFIRRAHFDSAGGNVGFLVPTPNTPILSAANDAIFTSLDAALKPQVVEKPLTGYRFGWLMSRDKAADGAVAPAVARPNPVTLQLPGSGITKKRQRIGGYDATILKASDVHSVERWLKRNNFKTGPGLRSWLQPYIERGWSLTAFKIRPGQNGTELSPVRLSFKTDKPYYPYREPAAARAKGAFAAGRTLKVYYLARHRPQGGIGDGSKWPGQLTYTAALPAPARADLVRGAALRPSQVPAQARLTVFNDTASPRPGTDEVFFHPAKDQGKVKPPAIEKVVDRRVKIPLELFILGIVGASIMTMKLTNRRFDR